MFDATAIKKIEDLVRANDDLRKIPGSPDFISLHVDPQTHKTTEVVADVGPSGYRFASLADMLAYGLPRHVGTRSAVLAYNDSQATLLTVEATLLAKTSRPVTHAMPLPKTQAFELVKELAEEDCNEYSPAELVKALRTTLRDCIEPSMAEKFRRIEANIKIGWAQATAPAKKTISREAARAITASNDAMPEEFSLFIPVFDLPGHRDRIGANGNGYKVRVLVDADADEKGNVSLTLTAVERDVREALEAALADIVGPNAKANEGNLQVVRFA